MLIGVHLADMGGNFFESELADGGKEEGFLFRQVGERGVRGMGQAGIASGIGVYQIGALGVR